MKEKTLKELREEAKARGLKGYSKLTKEALSRHLDTSKKPAKVSASTAKAPIRATKPATKKKSATNKLSKSPAAEKSAAASSSRPQTAEKAAEETKFALGTIEQPASPQRLPNLNEDIDRLPILIEPMVCLLPQKPGVLYAYWTLPPDESIERQDYKLRLSQLRKDTTKIYEEIAIHGTRGSWYFHVPENVGAQDMLLQLGYYRGSQFISAHGRSVVRVPNLYASTRTDHRWWISEEEFRRMYLRSGGMSSSPHRYSWSAPVGSSSETPTKPKELHDPKKN